VKERHEFPHLQTPKTFLVRSLSLVLT